MRNAKQYQNKKNRNRILLVLFLLAVCLLATARLALWLYPKQHSEVVARCCETYGLEAHFVYAMIKTESNFSTHAVSDKSATGLMQIMEPTGRWIAQQLGEPFSPADLSDANTNIRMGCFYISYLLDRYDGNPKNALAAYNAGYAKVDSWLREQAYSADGLTLTDIPYSETEQYVRRVIQTKKIYDLLYGADKP